MSHTLLHHVTSHDTVPVEASGLVGQHTISAVWKQYYLF